MCISSPQHKSPSLKTVYRRNIIRGKIVTACHFFFGLKNGILVLFIELALNILKVTKFFSKFIYTRMSNGQ